MTTKVIRVRTTDELSLLSDAAEIIRRGGLVVFPTETVYGLGADATNAEGAKKIYAAKGRPSDNPLIIHIAEPQDAERYAVTSKDYYRLAEAFMPGPLTVVLSAKDSVPRETRGGLDTVAVRCPSHPVAHELIRLAGVPIAAPSANLSGSPSPTSAPHVIDDMDGRVDMIIDGGSSDFGLESTIVKLGDDGATLLRPGKITLEELSSVLGEVKVSAAVTDRLKEGQVAESPGMKYRHYAPKAPVYLLDGATDRCIEYMKKNGAGKIAVLSYTDDREKVRALLPDADVFDFGERSDELTQAHRLFYLLREADKRSYDAIFAPLPNKAGVGLALYNRMIRAAAYQIITLR